MKMFIVVMLLVLSAAYMAAEDAPGKGADGTCQCAAFKDENDGKGEPLISKTPGFKVPCTDEGKENCHKMCMALAEAAKEKVPHVLCEKMGIHVEAMKPAAFYKACDAPEWTYTGLTSSDPICCHEGKQTKCSASA